MSARFLFGVLNLLAPVLFALYDRLFGLIEVIGSLIPPGSTKLQRFSWIRTRALHEDTLRTLRNYSGAYWLHCASGEFEYAKPVIRELKRQGKTIVVSYFSPTYVSAIQKTPEVDFSFPIPWDRLHHWERILSDFHPQALLMARTDVWLNLLRATGARGIPRILFASPLRQSRTDSLAKQIWLRFVLCRTDLISLVAEAEVEFVKSLAGSTTRVQADGDTRYDQVFERLSKSQPLKDEWRPTTQPVIVCGSTWAEDEEILVEAIRSAPNWKWILAPHEPSERHLTSLLDRLREVNISAAKYSERPHGNWTVLLIDRVGILAEVYQWGTAAFVGGSFRGSVHSVMEPLAAGLITFVGPDHLNNTEALRFQEVPLSEFQRLSPVNEIRSAEQLALFLEIIHGSSGGFQSEIQNLIKANRGASERLVRSALDFIQVHRSLR